jgi:hypothetical protein
MKAVYTHTAAALALTFGLAACVSAPPPAPTPPPVVRPAPTPTPTPAPPPVVQEPRYDNYLDAPQTPGDWRYSSDRFGSRAVFVGPGDEALFLITCPGPRNPNILMDRATTGEGPRAMKITTETRSTQLAAVARPRRTGLTKGMEVWETMPGSASVTIAGNDPLLDAMAITKGRFAVEIEGERTLYLPAWVEVSRVIEDCR